jgi:hypothetical protein
MSAYFFSEQWMKTFTPVSSNVDYQDLIPFIDPAQDQLIKVRIGKSLYEKLLLTIQQQNWNSNELELIKLIRPAVCLYTVYLALPFLHTKIRNKGLVKGTDQYIQTISKQDLLDLRQEFLQMSNYYMARVEEWLCNYSSLYPEYNDPNVLNNKTYQNPYEASGFLGYKGNFNGETDVDLILKMVNYKKY